MDDFASKIEALEHRWMRAWVQRDGATMKALASRDFIFVMGSASPAILDRVSWLDTAATRFRCSSYRFGNVYVRRHGSVAVFGAPVTLEATIDDEAFSGEAWVTDLWQRSTVRRKWRLVERVLARSDANPQIPAAIRSMQLWR